tara:strand:- start:4283 stop:5041 length:759 start_codon:yes stop_codon:yes gene_type:complete
MATLNLGNIKLNWKGAYAGGTAYVVDDVVSYSGSSYICKLASTGNLPTNGTYWDQVAAAGTDLGTTITTQGDVLYRDGSGLQRLAAGTSGHFLKTQGTGANPVWAEAGGGLVQTVFSKSNTSYQNGGTSYTNVITAQITPTSASNNILIFANSMGYYHHSAGAGGDRGHFWQILREVSGSDTTVANAEQRSDADLDGSFAPLAQSMYEKDDPNTTSQITYKMQMKGQGGSWDYYTNHNSTYASQIILMEVKV